jgi:hypothetical protein
MTRLAVAIVFVLAGSSCIAGNASERAILASGDYCLTKEEVAKYSQEAMAGSPEAADKLANSYWMCGYPANREKTKYWALVGAENGDAESQFRAFQVLRTSPEHLEQVRALFWLKQSAKQHFEDAENDLDGCEDLDSRYESGTPCFGPGSDQ